MDNSSAALPEHSNGASRKRGRPAGRPVTETPHERLARLEREMQLAKAAVHELEERKFSIIGAAILAETEEDAGLKAKLADILRRRVKSASAKADIAALLAI